MLLKKKKTIQFLIRLLVYIIKIPEDRSIQKLQDLLSANRRDHEGQTSHGIGNENGEHQVWMQSESKTFVFLLKVLV